MLIVGRGGFGDKDKDLKAVAYALTATEFNAAMRVISGISKVAHDHLSNLDRRNHSSWALYAVAKDG